MGLTMLDVSAFVEKSQRAQLAFDAGQIADAQQLCLEIVEADPNNFEATRLLGIAQHRRGQSQHAVASYDKALAICPGDADVLFNRGMALMWLKRLPEALASFDEALVSRTDHSETFHQRGNALSALNRFGEAMVSFDQALAINPNLPDALFHRGTICLRLERYDEALISFEKTLDIGPDQFEALYLSGIILAGHGRHDEALAKFDRAADLDPGHFDTLHHRGVTLAALDRLDEALTSLDGVLSIQPDRAETLSARADVLSRLERQSEINADDAEAKTVEPESVDLLNIRAGALVELGQFEEAIPYYDKALSISAGHAETLWRRGNALRNLDRCEQAIASYDQALADRPDHVEIYIDRATAFSKLGWLEDALASFDKALELKKDHAEVFNNRGLILKTLGRFDEALASFQNSCAIRNDYAEAHWNEGALQLLKGDFRRGWTKHEWRSKRNLPGVARRSFAQPRWDGLNSLYDKTILLYDEQNDSDAIQFCRYIPLMIARGARAILQVPENLQGLMASLSKAAEIIGASEPLPKFDLHCPLFDLPAAFSTKFESIPSGTPYLRAPAGSLSSWKMRLGVKERPRIGFSWAADPGPDSDSKRSMALSALMPLMELDATFVNLQRELHPNEKALLTGRKNVFYYGDALHDFSDLAALVACLDLVISVDASVAHLAGALGKPVWILLPYVPDWRWLLGHNHTPWYPTARLYRQSRAEDWDGVVAKVSSELPRVLSSGRA
jgi:tetratricopeptide (TPR) repeat protein